MQSNRDTQTANAFRDDGEPTFNFKQLRGFLPSGNTGDTYLRVPQATGVWIQVEFDSLTSARQCHATNQQHDEHDKRKRSSDVDHLRDRGSQTSQRKKEACTVKRRGPPSQWHER